MKHYEYLDKFFTKFVNSLGIQGNHDGMISAHGDKAYRYCSDFETVGIPFNHGLTIYLLTYLHPFLQECRNTDKGWVNPSDWVIQNYPKFQNQLLFIESGEKLVEGKLPTGTICPYRSDCGIAADNRCHHKSLDHSVSYSCGSARAYAMFSHVKI